LFLHFADKNYGSILSIKNLSVFSQLCPFPYTYEIGEALSAGGRGINPSVVGSHAGRFSCSVRAGRFPKFGVPRPRTTFLRNSRFRGKTSYPGGG
jgi:hypothetical protein